jgi:hypothetical protein
MSHSAKPDFLEGVQRFHSEGNCWCRLPSLLREHLLGLPSGDNPRSPVHPRSFAMVASQYGRIGTLSNQFGELLVAAGVPDAGPLWRRVGHESTAISHSDTHVGKEALSRAAKTFSAI